MILLQPVRLGCVVVLVVFAGAQFPLLVNPSAQQTQDATSRYVAGEVIVQFRPGTSAAAHAAALRAARAQRVRVIGRVDDGLELLATSLPVADSIAILERVASVEFAEPNWRIRATATSNDPQYGQQWGMHGDGTTPANVYGSQAGELWGRDHIGSSSVYVAVLDTGIDINHPDLTANIWRNPFDDLGDGVDDDGNGYADDFYGWDFRNDDNSVFDVPTADLHGTHVAGIIGARGGNAIGVAGVNWNVTIIAAKFLNQSTGTTADAIDAINYVTDLKTRHGLNIVAINNSWTSDGYNLALHQAIIRAARQDILFITAAGNGGNNNDVTPAFPQNYATNVGAGMETPASYDAVISVAAITSTGALWSSSNFGPTTVDIAAPGVDVRSTIPGPEPGGRYDVSSGTSMAAAHVTGAAAIYKAMNPWASARQTRDAILTHGTQTNSLVDKVAGAQRLNVGNFVAGSLPALSIDDVSVTEGTGGTTAATFTVSLPSAATSRITVDYATADGSAVGGVIESTSPITIPSVGNASPYPSTLTVPAGLGTITKLRVILRGFTHQSPNDVDVLLVGPSGQTVVLMSDAGGGNQVADVTVNFDDDGPQIGISPLTSGTYAPTNRDEMETFASPAPAGPYGTNLAAFIGTNPAGTWQLFVVDDLNALGGGVAGGWSLVMTTTTSDFVPTYGTLTFSPGDIRQTVSVPVVADNLVESTETFRLRLSNAIGATITDSEGVATIVNDDIFTDHPLSAGYLVKAIHILELRTMIDQRRVARGLGTFAFTESLTPGVSVIRAIHVSELRDALPADCRLSSYTDPVISPGVTFIRAAHINEIRASLSGCP